VNPFLSRTSSNSWVVPVSILSLVLGFMISLAWVTDQTRRSRIGLLNASQGQRIGTGPIELQSAYEQLSQEVAKLREEKTKLEKALGSQTGSSKVLNESLQESKAFAGLTEVEGPGIVVTLRDSQKPTQGLAQEQALHDVDVLRVVNELWNAGAEAITVNNHRLSTGSWFRCVGSVMHVDAIPVSSPIRIRAVGDAETLVGALNIPLGVLTELRGVDPSMVNIETVQKMRLPAYTGSTAHKHAKVPQDTK
jgi:uncharacterized protein YlxW (UPF0749 family)